MGIVLDREALIENNHDSLKDVFYVLEDVEYTCDHNPYMEVLPGDYSTASDLVHKNYKEIFFKKDIVWKNEGEILSRKPRVLYQYKRCYQIYCSWETFN